MIDLIEKQSENIEKNLYESLIMHSEILIAFENLFERYLRVYNELELQIDSHESSIDANKQKLEILFENQNRALDFDINYHKLNQTIREVIILRLKIRNPKHTKK